VVKLVVTGGSLNRRPQRSVAVSWQLGK